MRGLVGLAIRVYRRTPLYPAWGQRLARLLSMLPGRGRGEPILHEVRGFRMRLDLNEVIDSQIYYTGSFEPDAVRTIEKVLPQGGTAIDVGANVGWLSLVCAARVGPTGRVYALEPTPWALERLRANLALNPELPVSADQVAVGETPERGLEFEAVSSYRVDGTSTAEHVRVDMVTLDDYADRHGIDRVDFIKIDTDGFEFPVLSGARRVLETMRPAILFEMSPDDYAARGYSPSALIAYLESLGYGFFEEGTLEPIAELDRRIAAIPAGCSVGLVARHERGSNGEV